MMDAILVEYPRAPQCIDGHAQSKLVFSLELDDDRYYVMVINRCSLCNMPMGGENYANQQNERRYYAGEEPIAQ